MLLQGSPNVIASVTFLTVCFSITVLQAQLTNNEVGLPVPKHLEGSRTKRSNSTEFAWTAWGKWSPCSRTCGGGVSVQERHCLPRDPSRLRRSRKRRKLSHPAAPRRTRAIFTKTSHCPGLDKRYHECNTVPCSGEQKESRAEQCAAYDRRPFRGRFYTWVPYVDGDQPCTLNCRPLGQQFYASLGLAADGTPCTKPGFRAICVQGTCKVVGREGILSSASAHETRCGKHLVSGLFTRPRLPLGYSLVTTVPKGACRLNVTELQPSDNYIALKLLNGSYIMNGEFAVSAPGAYEAAGARFHYSRNANLDSVYSHGPIQHPLDIMILYTQPNPSIKYEYFSDSDQDETSNDIPLENNNYAQQDSPHQRHHRHHISDNKILQNKHDLTHVTSTGFNDVESRPQFENKGERKFSWKITSYTQCSRTCGGGIQLGKFRCVEASGVDKEVSPAHCGGLPPSSRRRRCGLGSCPARWRAAPWGPCPVCGPAQRTRIVGCVQDHVKGITKISDQNCPLPMPPTKEDCDIPNCNSTSASTEMSKPDTRRQIHPRERVEAFRDNTVISLASNTSANEIGPVYEPNYSHSAAGGWLYTEWSDCVGWCVGGGTQSRGVRCADPSGCAPRKAPQVSQTCKPRLQCDPHDGQWFTSEWSKCSAACGGRQVRGVLCVGGTGRRLRDAACKALKPETERACGGSCSPSWYLSDWGECEGPCEAGVQSRTVWCARGGAEGAEGAAKDADCPGLRPPAKRNCVPSRCSTRPSVRPTVVNTGASDPQQRVTRHQNRNTPNVDIKDRSFTDGSKLCADKLTNCALAVQARLCHYHYYAEYCCRSCQGR